MTTNKVGRLALAGSLVIGLATLPESAFGDLGLPCKRAALVIGNSEYEHPSWELFGPRHDAEQMGDALENLGFKVRTILDADQLTLFRGLTDFQPAAAAADVAVMFYSGHSSPLTSGRGEYLIPVDAIPTDGLLHRSQGVPMNLVLWAVQPARELRLVIMDADHSEPPGISSEMLFVAYAGRPGESTNDGPTTTDGDDEKTIATSPYTSALLHHLRLPDAGSADLGIMFRSVGFQLSEWTGYGRLAEQTPVVYGTFPYERVVLSTETCLPGVEMRRTFPVPEHGISR